MQMILKSMGVKVDKDEMDGYAAEVDEEAAGKFTFEQFCQVIIVIYLWVWDLRQNINQDS